MDDRTEAGDERLFDEDEDNVESTSLHSRSRRRPRKIDRPPRPLLLERIEVALVIAFNLTSDKTRL